MASNYTEEKLNSLDKETIIQLFLSQQDQLERLDHTLQLMMEQLADLKRHRFSRSTERHEIEGQILLQIASSNGHLCHIWRTARDIISGQARTH